MINSWYVTALQNENGAKMLLQFSKDEDDASDATYSRFFFLKYNYCFH